MNGLRALHVTHEKREQQDEPWQNLAILLDFEQFREPLEACWRRDSKPKRGGRPPWDAVLMLKILLVGLKTRNWNT